MEIENKSIGIVGASNNPEKYGYKVVEAVKKITNKVYPINPKESEILGVKAYSSPTDIKEKLDILVFVTPPAITLEVLTKNIKSASFFWFQPGSFDQKVIDFCIKNDLNMENKKCIIIESSKVITKIK
jgi:predicted CoA-binding protein